MNFNWFRNERADIINGENAWEKGAKEYFNAPNENTISRVCRGERKAYKGHKLRYQKN